MSSVMLIDGKNFLYRNHYAHRTLTTSEGEPTGVLYGCLIGLLSLANKFKDTPIAFVWDGRGETWRHQLLKPQPKKDVVRKPETWLDKRVQGSLSYLGQSRSTAIKEKPVGYKAQRNLVYATREDSRPEALRQLPELLRALKLIGVQSFKVDNLEGDDLVGILMAQILKRKIFDEVIIHSTDRDFYQFLQYEGLKILAGFTKEGKQIWIREEDVLVKYGVTVEDWISYRALIGDSTDNIPQLRKGLGPVKCKRLLSLGLNPFKANNPDEVPEEAWNAYEEYCRERIDRMEVWKHLRRSYIASKIITGTNFGMFSDEVRDKLAAMMSELARESFERKPFTEEAYRELSEWLVEKEMDQLRGRVAEFNSLC